MSINTGTPSYSSTAGFILDLDSLIEEAFERCGLQDRTGYELKTASTLFDNTVIRPFQRLLLDGIKKIMNANGYNLDVYFKTLQPLEFTDLSGKAVDKETEEKEYGFKQVKLESYTDYPESASNNAKRALEWVEKHGSG